MNKQYDLIIVGMGPSAIFCAIEMLRIDKSKKVLLIDQGKRVEDRFCPIEKTKKCIKCKPMCNITNGFSGAGAFSDGKLSLYNDKDDDIYVGGILHKYIGVPKTKELIDYTDKIYLEFGADKKLEGIEYKEEIAKISKRAEKDGIKLINIPIRHLGTEKSHEVYKRLEEYLEKNGIDLMFETMVEDLIIENNNVKGVAVKESKYFDDKNGQNLKNIYADKVVLAVRKKRSIMACRNVQKTFDRNRYRDSRYRCKI